MAESVLSEEAIKGRQLFCERTSVIYDKSREHRSKEHASLAQLAIENERVRTEEWFKHTIKVFICHQAVTERKQKRYVFLV